MPAPATAWLHHAIARIEADYQRSADTHLIALPLPGFARHGIDLYLKDESTHPTGSLKHRLARSLFLYALCNGWLHEHSTVIEASSGSTAVSEAYFARLLGLPFVAVMAKPAPAGSSTLIWARLALPAT
jgi:cysteine synthase A